MVDVRKGRAIVWQRTSFLWSDDRVERLKALFAEGLSGAQIAADFDCGISRSSVIGKLHRLGLMRGRPRKETTKTNARNYAARQKDSSLGYRLNKKAAHPPAEPRARPISPATDKPDAVFACTLVDLTDDMCRWIYGEPGLGPYQFCGRPGADMREGTPYCRTHTAMAYLPMRARQVFSKEELVRSSEQGRRNFHTRNQHEGAI